MTEFNLHENNAISRVWKDFDDHGSDAISFNDYVLGVSTLINKGSSQMKIQCKLLFFIKSEDPLMIQDSLIKLRFELIVNIVV